MSGVWDRDEAGAFIEELFAKHNGEIYAYLFRMMRDSELAADMTQDAFVKAYKNYDTLEKPENARAWLYQIAHRVALDEIRRRKIVRFLPWTGESRGSAPSAEHLVMRNALAYAGAADLPIVDHPEDATQTDGAEANDGFIATILGLRGWPTAAEETAVARDLAILAEVARDVPGARLHLTHVSTAGSLELVRRAKAAGLPVTCDVTPHHMSETTDLLAKVPLLSSLDEKQLERLARDFSERTFPAGSVVVREGDTHGMGFFVVADGEGTVSVGGKEVGKIGRGSYFGEVALISDRTRTATVTATTDLRTLVMTFWDFRAFVKSDADVAWKLLEHVGGMLHGRG